MTGRALILTYHGVEAGPGPLWTDPDLFTAQLDSLRDCGAVVLTLSEIAEGLANAKLPEGSVAITFDDGFLSVAETAAPLLIERGMRATIFCVAGRLGQDNRWSTEPPSSPRRQLATAGALSELAASGFEIGAHGMQHLPLRAASTSQLRQEILDSRECLEQELGTQVSSFAYPYGVMPRAAGRALIRSAYSQACTTRPGYALASTERSELPRVDIHYLRRPALLRRAAGGKLHGYLGLRRRGAWVRRLAVKDHVTAPGS